MNSHAWDGRGDGRGEETLRQIRVVQKCPKVDYGMGHAPCLGLYFIDCV